MPEGVGSNIEVAHHLSELKGSSRTTAHEVLEIAEAIVLAIIAIATAWSGYQAALWTGEQATLYQKSSKLRIQAQGAAIMADQERLYNGATAVEWLKAETHGETKLSKLFERRFLPDFRPTFEAWKRTDPLHNPESPPGPQFMKEYHDSKTEDAGKLNDQASEVFEQGDIARKCSDDYVRATVTLATVLMLMIISQRFKVQGVRVALTVLAVLLLCLPLYRILMLPQA